MNEPQLMKSRQINNNSGNTLKRAMLNARIFAKVLFYFGGGEFKCALRQDVPPESQTFSSGSTETTSRCEHVLDLTRPRLQFPLCSLLS